MSIASFLMFWRNLKSFKWRPCAIHTHLVKLIQRGADLVAEQLIVLFPIIIKQIKRSRRRMIRFCRFFLYLNPRTFKKLIQATIEQRLPGFAADMANHAT